MSTSSRTWDDLVGYCRDTIEQIGQQWAEWHPRRAQGRKPPLDQLFRFAGQTVSAILSEMKQQRPLQAIVLCRVLFELTHRLAWAGATPRGYDRLLAYWYSEDQKFLKPGLETGLLNAERSREFEDASAQVARALDKLKVSPAPGSMPCLLKQIRGSSGQGSNQDFPWEEGVYCLYRDLCRTAHGNLVFLGNEWTIAKSGRPVVMHVTYATVGLIWAQKRLMGHQLSETDRRDMDALVEEAHTVCLG